MSDHNQLNHLISELTQGVRRQRRVHYNFEERLLEFVQLHEA
jgi:hypothetical protein